MTNYDFDADELHGDWSPADDEPDYDEAMDGEECGACGRPATHIDHNEPVCSRHSAKDVYGM